jgi:hypothetical protein
MTSVVFFFFFFSFFGIRYSLSLWERVRVRA